jgi:uncharacterized spore protein YtfJ
MKRFGVHEGGGEGGAGRDNILPASLLERFAEKLGYTARSATIFGEAVEREGVTVIPIAKAKWGLGGGGGHRRPGAQEGLGGGGGVTVAPVGYIEVKNGESRFRPIWDPMTTIVAGLGAGALLLLAFGRFRRRDEP